MENKKKDHLGRNIFIVVALLVSIVLIIGFAPVMSKAYSVDVTEPVQVSIPYTETITVPVQVQQPYTETVTSPVETTQPLSYQVTSATLDKEATWLGLGSTCGMHFLVTMRNTDQQAGDFAVYFTYSSASWVKHGQASVSVAPNEWQTAYYDAGLLYCNEITNWDYEITPSTKTVTKYQTHTETRYRTVTEYQTRQETRYRTETQYRTRSETRYHKVSLLNSWID